MNGRQHESAWPAGTLVGKKGSGGIAHIWLGSDTACHMYSTGGLKKHRLVFGGAVEGRPVCKMCQAVHAAARPPAAGLTDMHDAGQRFDWKAAQPVVDRAQVVYLTCDYRERAEVKRRGAKWDSVGRRWYVMKDEDLAPFLRWLPGYTGWAATLSRQQLADVIA